VAASEMNLAITPPFAYGVSHALRMPQFNAPSTCDAVMPVIRFACMNRCVAAAEEAARVALACGVFREGLTNERDFPVPS
jgi:hypothetical protein